MASPQGGRSPRVVARATGLFWLIVFLAGMLALRLREGALASAANYVAASSYLVVTVLLYVLLRPVGRSVALVATGFGIAGCIVSLFRLSGVIHVRDLVFFGVQCVLVGYLILRSTFLPRLFGGLMVLGGLGYLTMLAPSFADRLEPYNLMPGILAEGLLILWLLAKGVDPARWTAQAAPGT